MRNRREIEKRLNDLRRIFDPDYQYTEDHSVWRRHSQIESEIFELESLLDEMEEEQK